MNARISAMDYSFQAGVDNTPMPTAAANEKEFENTGPIVNQQLVSDVVRMDADLQTQQPEMVCTSDDIFGAITSTVSDGARSIGQQLSAQLSTQVAMNDPVYSQDPNNPDPNQQQVLDDDEGPRSVLDTTLTAAETVHTHAATQSYEMKLG